MSAKSMFFRIIMSEIKFFAVCIFIFVAHLAFWLDEIGIAERVFNIYITPSVNPIYFLGIIYLLAIFIFISILFKHVKRLQVSNFKNSKRAFLISVGLHLLALSCSLFFWFAPDLNPMKTVIPALMALYLATITLILLALYFSLFVKTNKNTIGG